MRLSELKHKEIIDIDSGIRLGKIGDSEISFDAASGKLIDLMIPGQDEGFRLFGKCEVQLVAWDRISKISEDFILISAHSSVHK